MVIYQYTSEVISSKAPLEEQKSQNLYDILYSFSRYPLYIHKLQLQLSLESRYYTDIQKTSSRHNKSKQHEEKTFAKDPSLEKQIVSGSENGI